jgi:GNAT superfamily N-acetyltransferase
VEIKNLSISDYDDLIELWRHAGLPIKLKGRDARNAFVKQLESFPELFIGGFDDEKLIASVIGSDDGRKGWINRLAVHLEYRNKGIARRLLNEMENRLRKRGRKIICVLIEEWNKQSITFFIKNKYVLHKDIFYCSKREGSEV